MSVDVLKGTELDFSHLEDAIKKVETHIELLLEYQEKDPSIIHFHSEWQRLQKDCSKLYAELESLKIYIHPEQLPLLLAHQRQLSRYTTKYFSSYMQELAEHSENHHSIHRALQQLRANPFFISTESRKQHEEDFSNLWKHSVSMMAEEIVQRSRHLFLQLTYEEMIEQKSERCPNFLNIAQYFNQLNLFVIHDILSHPQLNARTAAMSYWIQVAQALYVAGDFNSLRSVEAALSSIPVTQLKNTRAGLSVEDEYTYANLKDFIRNNQAVNAETERRKEIIPYVGTFRTVLERTKTLEEKEHIAQQLLTLQAAHSEKPAVSTIIIDWVQKHKLTNLHEINKLSDALIVQAKILEPSGSQQLPGRLCDENQCCWLKKLRNRELMNTLIHRQLIFKTEISQTEIDELNVAVRMKFSDHEFKQRLVNAGIDLGAETIHSLNKANRQLYYRCLIENSALRNCIGNKVIHRTKIGDSTTHHILEINALLRQGTTTEILANHLALIDVKLSIEELNSVIAECNQTRAHSILSESEQLIASTRSLLKEFKVNRLFKSTLQTQLADYLSLLKHSDDLDSIDKESLLTEFRCVCPGDGFSHSAYNPFLLPVQRLQLHLQRLRQLRDQLTSTNLHEKALLDEIHDIERIVSSGQYQHLFHSHSLIQQWVVSNGEPDESLKRAITKSAPFKLHWRFKFFELRDYLEHSIQKIKHRSYHELKGKSYESLWEKTTKHFIPAIQSLIAVSRDSEIMRLSLNDLNSLAVSIDKITHLTEVHQMAGRLNDFSALHRLDYVLQSLKKITEDVQGQFNLCALLKKRSEKETEIDEHYRGLFQRVNFGKNLTFAGQFAFTFKSTVNTDTVYPEFNLVALDMLKKLQAIESALEKKRKQLSQADAHPQHPHHEDHSHLFNGHARHQVDSDKNSQAYTPKD